MQASERVNRPISTEELERRWREIRARMKEAGIDVLLMQNTGDHVGGYVKYFTDQPATNGYPLTVVFPADDLMTLVRMGPFGGVRELPAEGDGVLRGVKRVLSTPSFTSVVYTGGYDADLALTALRPFAAGTIGVVGPAQLSHAFLDRIRTELAGTARFVDASELVDRVKAIKSPEEQARTIDAARMQDAAMEAAFAAIKPGMRDREVASVAQYYSHCHGSEQGIYLCASAPMGTPAVFGQFHLQNRVIREGDQFALLIENNGPGGFYTELGRTCVVGRASQELQDEFAFTLQARRFTLDLLKPGTPASEVARQYNAMMRKHGRPEEARIYCHGQGYDMVERPLIRDDETFLIAENMNIVVHPTYVFGGVSSWVCDNYLIGPDGPGERLHRFPETVAELG